MKKQNIDLADFISKGNVEHMYKDNFLFMKTNRAIPTRRFDKEHLSVNSYMYLPYRYKLPLRIDLTVKIDAPGFYLLFGKGHINFGTLISDNRRIDDIVAPSRKTALFHNYMKMDEFTDISVLYDLNEMQILINGEERYDSKKEKYMKASAFDPMNAEGFEFKLACDKLVNLCIKSVCITEYEDTCKINHEGEDNPSAITSNYMKEPGEKLTFEKYISLLPTQFRIDITHMDAYLKSLKAVKMKRILEKNGNKITYVSSDYGFSYAIHLSNDVFYHTLQWYVITKGKPDTWHRKADMMEETLRRLRVKMPEFADRMFYNLEDCVGCYNHCLVKTRYQLQDKQKHACHGRLQFQMNTAGFQDARIFIDEINQIVKETP
ncbi:hypothetical protein acsn021_14410 [Anaerocolumna cellulosilytica]|uniref:Uncharacterized protein n=1 Tax=Anaerocolumna cellulosilytica TaxID=433286 RepID=A0A6S6R2Z2_9FIRM|nr:hypothetical protein [Anaerocolumna cellulosilytica]MBB5195628.1 hypothetical protein [Anaerocolumna cellulosilytica]BCJ93872.1 hypothetical protein acsn021_14410 [Anaerocolumna cellulosilytica]